MDIINESYIEESKTSRRLYHVSQSNLDGKTIQPSVPNNFMTKNGYEDGKTKRVCFSSSIDGCLRALSQKCPGMKLFVHVPDGEYDTYKPSVKEVPDVKITKEVWIKEPVKLKCIGQISVIGDRGEKGMPYKYGDKTAELYDWDWRWIEKVNESYTQEGYIKDTKDIYYNKDKFDSGEVNLCFITGLSGSGKSTMGRSMSSKNIEHYEMDDVICNDNFSDANLKEYGSLIESFFKGPGKSFRLIKNDDENNEKVLNSHKNYEKEITQSFVKHALSYCKSHTKTKYVCDGIWTFMFINPEQLKDCAVYIKGTSSLKSGYRALKRDIGEDKRNGLNTLQIFKREFRRVKEDVLYAKQNQKDLQYFRSYFEKQSTSESYIEESKKDDDIFITIPDIDKDHIRTVIKTLSNDIDNFQDLLFIKIFDYNIAFDNGKPVGFILVRLKPLGNDKYAGSISIAVDPKQRRKGLAEFLTKNMIEYILCLKKEYKNCISKLI